MVVAAVLGLSHIVAAAHAAEWCDQVAGGDAALLSKGEPLVRSKADPEGGSGVIEGCIDIPVAPATLWELMLDCAKAKQFLEDLVECRVTERDSAGAWDVREQVMDVSALLPNLRSVFRSDYTLHREIRFRQLSGNLDLMEGHWRLRPFADGQSTRLTYRARIASSLPVPDSLIRSILAGEAPRTLTLLRREAIAMGAPR
ncbi:MAG TPA: hypothetical protein DCL54_15510 [Alphaproteobacteria bacterium]|nr:hypothetical protein [Alphaproteobacteria bacterium]HAJ47979.1 hypothetical protein [Alphaproteobacteria bacterium]